MSIPYRHTNDAFVSVFTSKQYPFSHSADGSDRQRAFAALQKDDAPLVQAAQSRALKELGRELSFGEMIRGNWGKDPRTLRQKIAEDGHVTTAKPDERNENVYTSYREEVQSRRVYTPNEKAALQRRIERAEELEANHEKELIAQRELEEARSKASYARAKLDAELMLAKLNLDSSVSQHDVSQAQKRLNELKSTGDSKAYWAKALAYQNERQLHLQETADALDAQANELRTAAQSVRDGEPVEAVNE